MGWDRVGNLCKHLFYEHRSAVLIIFFGTPPPLLEYYPVYLRQSCSQLLLPTYCKTHFHRHICSSRTSAPDGGSPPSPSARPGPGTFSSTPPTSPAPAQNISSFPNKVCFLDLNEDHGMVYRIWFGTWSMVIYGRFVIWLSLSPVTGCYVQTLPNCVTSLSRALIPPHLLHFKRASTTSPQNLIFGIFGPRNQGNQSVKAIKVKKLRYWVL